MPPDERREALVLATLPLLRQHGRAVTTRQIAAAAGVAEGTIFGVFESKEQLVDEAITKAFEPGSFVHQHDELDASLPFRERMVALVALLQRRFLDTFDLMRAVGLVSPPHGDKRRGQLEQHRREISERMVALVGDDAVRLRIPAEEFVRVLRLLTFSASHHEIADGRLLTPEEIVGIVLDGVLIERGD
jgi:AcrR family transcriptional regulator